MCDRIDVSDQCEVCHEIDWRTEEFMVHNELWEQTGFSDLYVCVGCVEKKLGRELNAQDFNPDVLLNHFTYDDPVTSDRLIDRMDREP